MCVLSTGNRYVWILATVFLMAVACPTNAMTVSVLHTFRPTPTGAYPKGPLAQGGDGYFYGTAGYGGAFGAGTIFRVSSTGRVSTAHSFHKDDGLRPSSGLIAVAPGVLVGATEEGGAFGNGVLFQFTTSGRLKVLHSFTNAEGAVPDRVSLGRGGELYGTLTKGGSAGSGAVYKADLSGHVSILHSFSGPDGSGPTGNLVVENGAVYGATKQGGSTDMGTVFRMRLADRDFSIVHTFGGDDGAAPVGGVVEGTDDALYGVTSEGADFNIGTAYRITTGGVFTVLFKFGESRIGQPWSGLTTDGSGTFFGGLTGGTIYGITQTGDFIFMHQTSPDLRDPVNDVFVDSTGTIWGTTWSGGANRAGTVFAVYGGIAKFMTAFGGFDGSVPVHGLTQTGNVLLGITAFGGRADGGTVYRYDLSTGGYAVLRSFTGFDGWRPWTALVSDGSGSYYGTTQEGGPDFKGPNIADSGFGVVYRISAGGTFRLVHAFHGFDGRIPSVLIRGIDGMFYGATRAGGANDYGTVFRMTPAGQVTTLHTFSGLDGFAPTALTFDNAGNLYGVAAIDGAGGTLFRVSSTGEFTNVRTIAYEEAYQVLGIVYRDGYIYGVGGSGGPGYTGSVFRYIPGGELTVLHGFDPFDAAYPNWPLAFDANGRIYDTVSAGEPYNLGGIFTIGPDGTYAKLFDFDYDSPPGAFPAAGLIKDELSSRLFGTSAGGGPLNTGALFQALP